MRGRDLPIEFTAMLDRLAESYLRESDPVRASGFGGGDARWRSEREPILDAVAGAGDLLDVGCANGYLLECLVAWGAERGLALTPHGVDRSEALIQLARSRLHGFERNLHVGDAWTWVPPRRYDYVYALHDCVPLDYLPEYVERLLERAVAPRGRLILGAYGSRSRGTPPYDVRGLLDTLGHSVSGWTAGGRPPVSLFAWTDAACER